MTAWTLEPYADEAILEQYVHDVVNVLAYREQGWTLEAAQVIVDAFRLYHHTLNTRSRLFLVTAGCIEEALAARAATFGRVVLLYDKITAAERRACFLMAHVTVFVTAVDEDGLDLARRYGIPTIVVGSKDDIAGTLTWQESNPKLIAHSLHHVLENSGCLVQASADGESFT